MQISPVNNQVDGIWSSILVLLQSAYANERKTTPEGWGGGGNNIGRPYLIGRGCSYANEPGESKAQVSHVSLPPPTSSNYHLCKFRG